jgi:hypothetical protein
MGQIPRKTELHKLAQEEGDNLNRSIRKEKSNKRKTYKENLNPDGFTGEFYQLF